MVVVGIVIAVVVIIRPHCN